jgi:hypothetical protein
MHVIYAKQPINIKLKPPNMAGTTVPRTLANSIGIWVQNITDTNDVRQPKKSPTIANNINGFLNFFLSLQPPANTTMMTVKSEATK